MTTNKLYAAMFYLYVIHVDISKEQGLTNWWESWLFYVVYKLHRERYVSQKKFRKYMYTNRHDIYSISLPFRN